MLFSRQMAGKLVAEFIGTFVIIFLGCGSIIVNERFPGTVSPTAVPVIFGLAVAAMIYSVGHISGAHFNPAVTLAFAVGRHFPVKGVVAYWLAQFGGAIAASALLNLILPVGPGYGATITVLGPAAALTWEIMLTFILIFVIIAVATDTRAVGTMAGAAIGAAVTIGSFVGGPVTGASMNPARTLGPALFQGVHSSMWIYFVGPAVGATLAALAYGFIRHETALAPADKKKGSR